LKTLPLGELALALDDRGGQCHERVGAVLVVVLAPCSSRIFGVALERA
jgi:hypothetical protein